MMLLFIHKRFMVFFLVVAVLLVPFNSVAHDMASGTTHDSCTSLLMTIDCSVDNSGQQPDQFPFDNSGDCCDSEECGHEATEPPVTGDMSVNPSVKQLFSTYSHSHIPTVYLAIFVPPES